jgi:ATP-dependent Lon protease
VNPILARKKSSRRISAPAPRRPAKPLGKGRAAAVRKKRAPRTEPVEVLVEDVDSTQRVSPRGKSAAQRKTGKKSGKDKSAVTVLAGAPAMQSGGVMSTFDVAIVPVRNMILFPGVALPLMLGRPQSVAAVKAATAQGAVVGLLLQRDESVEIPEPEDLYDVGTIAEIVRYWQAPDGRHQAICQGQERFRVLQWLQKQPFPIARVELIRTPIKHSRALDARFLALRQRAQEVLELAPGAPEDLSRAVDAIDSPSQLADLVATFMSAPPHAKQEILETFDLKERLDKLIRALGDVAAVLELSQKIRLSTRGSLDQAQREYFLREQMRQIQLELGEDAESSAPDAEDVIQLARRIEEVKAPEEATQEARREYRRLRRTPEHAAEHSMLRGWLETFVELPWNVRTKEALDIERAEQILDEDHQGLVSVKKRIIEFLAVKKLNPHGQGPVLCLVGPPGVGKTSLGQSIARATGRKYARLSLGGVHDEGEIRGHRRTYIGAMLGKVLDGLRRAGSRNPVFVLDEVDKLGRGMHGDPASALLEVLDPAQNNTFRDNFMGLPFDLSEVLFVATANVEDHIPEPLRDRMEVIRLPGYTEEEKLEIARRHLVPKQIAAAGLRRTNVSFTLPGLREVVRFYTREAGVRNLERKLAALTRHAAMLTARGKRAKKLTFDADLVRAVLGPKRMEYEVRQRATTPGVATGLAWTPTGGEILFVEATRVPGTGKLTLTGQLGDVMKESGQAAASVLRGRAVRLGLDSEELAKYDVHMHVPAGAVPKDGPSAGIAMYLALASLATGRRVRPDVAVTGEVSLRGLALPVGGIKEKVLGALAAGIRTIILPERNRADVEEVPVNAKKRLTFVFVEDVDGAQEAGLE